MAMAAPSQANPSPAPGSTGGARFYAIDILRGMALCGMVLFHTAWDLAYWGWTDTGPAQSPAWMAFGHGVAATFLFVSGFCLVLAHHRGLASALRRIAVLAAVAGLITVVTLWLFPDDFIYFGIIHCIALANLVALPFRRAPVSAILLAGCAIAMAPRLMPSAGLDGPLWWSLGLSSSMHRTLDYRPLLPWMGVVLFGVAAARVWPRLPQVAPPLRWASGLAWAGRHSLMVYVVHQPILFGLFFLMAMIHPRGAADEAAAFHRQCQAQCVEAGAGRAGCTAACACMFEKMRSRLEPDAQASSASQPDLQAASRTCIGASPSPP